MKKIIRSLSFFFLILLHFSFLLAIFFEKLNTPLVIIFLLVISSLVTLGYFNSPKDEEEHFLEDLYLIVFVCLGSVATFYLNADLKLGPIISAGFMGTLASFIPYINKKSAFLKELPAAVYCGSFVGMTAPTVAEGFTFIVFASFITGVFLILSKNIFSGFGGKLGTIAFGGVALTTGIIFLLF